MKLLFNRHLYTTDLNQSLNTATPTYQRILRDGDEIIPQGKTNCIVRPNAGSLFKLRLTKNARIPPPLVIAIDRLKTTQNLQGDLSLIQNIVNDGNLNGNESSQIHHGGTALHAAAAAYDVGVGEQVPAGLMQIMLESGRFNLGTLDRRKQTALHVAAKAGSEEAVRALLEHAGDQQGDTLHVVRNKDGKTAFELAVAAGEKADRVKELFYEGRFGAQYAHWKPTAFRDHITAWARVSLNQLKNSLRNRNLDVNYKFPDSDGATLLHLATSSYALTNTNNAPHRSGLLTMLLRDARFNPNVRDNQGRTPLHHAVVLPSTHALMELLADPRVDINHRDNDGKAPLLYAITANSPVHVINALLRNPRINADVVDNEGKNCLHLAVIANSPVAMTWLDDNGDKVNHQDSQGQTPLHYAISRNFTEFVTGALANLYVNPAIADNRGRTPMHLAVLENNLTVIRGLLRRADVDVNARDESSMTPLEYAVSRKFIKASAILIEDARTDINALGSNSEAPLHFAIRENLGGIVNALMGQDTININVRGPGGQTPLHIAVDSGRDDVVAALLARSDVMINSKNDEMQTPLHMAARGQSSTIAEALLRHPRIMLDAKDKNGRTAYDIATDPENPNGSFFMEAYNKKYHTGSGASGSGTKPREDNRSAGESSNASGSGTRTHQGIDTQWAPEGFAYHDFDAPMNGKLAAKLLGIENFNELESKSKDEARKHIKQGLNNVVRSHHPDRVNRVTNPGISDDELEWHGKMMRSVNNAYEYLNSWNDKRQLRS